MSQQQACNCSDPECRKWGCRGTWEAKTPPWAQAWRELNSLTPPAQTHAYYPHPQPSSPMNNSLPNTPVKLATQQTIELRMQCLKLAVAHDPRGAVKLAGEYLAFVTGQESQNPRERILSALSDAGV